MFNDNIQIISVAYYLFVTKSSVTNIDEARPWHSKYFNLIYIHICWVKC